MYKKNFKYNLIKHLKIIDYQLEASGNIKKSKIKLKRTAKVFICKKQD